MRSEEARQIFKRRQLLEVICQLRFPDILKTDLCGFTIPNEFVVGYGLDYANYYRNLPYIGVLRPECYQ